MITIYILRFIYSKQEEIRSNLNRGLKADRPSPAPILHLTVPPSEIKKGLEVITNHYGSLFLIGARSKEAKLYDDIRLQLT